MATWRADARSQHVAPIAVKTAATGTGPRSGRCRKSVDKDEQLNNGANQRSKVDSVSVKSDNDPRVGGAGHPINNDRE